MSDVYEREGVGGAVCGCKAVGALAGGYRDWPILQDVPCFTVKTASLVTFLNYLRAVWGVLWPLATAARVGKRCLFDHHVFNFSESY